MVEVASSFSAAALDCCKRAASCSHPMHSHAPLLPCIGCAYQVFCFTLCETLVHLLEPLLESAETGTAIFKLISPDDAVKKLRQLLSAVGVRDARLSRPHDLRRGHSEDLRLEGAPLWKILAAGEWRSAAFQAYLGLHKPDVDDALSGALDDESDDDIEP